MEQESVKEGGLRLKLGDWLQDVGGQAGGQSQVGKRCLKTFQNRYQSREAFAVAQTF